MAEPEPLRLAEILAALSLVTDLARGHPPEEAIRACLVALRLAESAGLPDGERADVYYTTLLRFVGCTASSHAYAEALGGDDVAVRAQGDLIDPADPRESLAFILGLGVGLPSARRAATVATALARGPRVAKSAMRADCEVATQMARRLDLDPGVETALGHIFERWDGKGTPHGLKGDGVATPARFAGVAFTAVLFHEVGSRAAAVQAVRRWSGHALDPAIARIFLKDPSVFLQEVEDADPWEGTLAAEPAPQRRIAPWRVDDVAAAFADVVDLKTPYFHGHCSGGRGPRRTSGGIGGPRREVGGAHAPRRVAARSRSRRRSDRCVGEARAALHRRMGAGSPASLSLGAHPRSLPRPLAARIARGHAPRASRR